MQRTLAPVAAVAVAGQCEQLRDGVPRVTGSQPSPGLIAVTEQPHFGVFVVFYEVTAVFGYVFSAGLYRHDGWWGSGPWGSC